MSQRSVVPAMAYWHWSGGFMGRKTARLRQALILTIVGFMIAAGGSSVAIVKAGPQVPKQFYRPLGKGFTAGERAIVPVAHNAGNNPRTARSAIRGGAGVIEIDVLIYQGRLVAAHHLPETRLNQLAWMVSPPQLLAAAWNDARAAAYVQLDLKTGAPELAPMLLDFLAERSSLAKVIVSGPELDVLNQVAAAYPEIDTVLSIGSLCRMAIVQSDPESLQALRGVSVRASLLDGEVVTGFHDRGLFVLAWTVDDPSGLNRLMALGVDAIATNNLAIIEQLRAPDGVGATLER
jgi:glycerophosphoryl diester phosphodiesterase